MVFFACGCGGAAEPSATVAGDGKPDYVLAELLDKPRSELAEMSAELQARVTLQKRAAQEGRLSLAFLPNLPIPLIVPIWTEAAYSAKRGISLPSLCSGRRARSGTQHASGFRSAIAMTLFYWQIRKTPRHKSSLTKPPTNATIPPNGRG